MLESIKKWEWQQSGSGFMASLLVHLLLLLLLCLYSVIGQRIDGGITLTASSSAPGLDGIETLQLSALQNNDSLVNQLSTEAISELVETSEPEPDFSNIQAAQQSLTTATLGNFGDSLLKDLPADIRSRLNDAGAGVGDVMIALSWNTPDDLDLHVVTPKNYRIFYNQTKSPCGGELDVDANADNDEVVERPVEHIYWHRLPVGKGGYRVEVKLYHRRQFEPIRFKVYVTVLGQPTRVFERVFRRRKRSDPAKIYTFSTQ